MRPSPRGGAPPGRDEGPTRAANSDEAPSQELVTLTATTYPPKVTEPADIPPSTRGRHRPVAFASLYGPCAGRAQWVLSYRCPVCRGTHFGRIRTAGYDGGQRRTRCGRTVWIVIARTYRGEAAS